MQIILSESKELDKEKVLALYKANQWSSADKPDELIMALKNSHSLITAWDGDKLIGLGNSLSDGYLAVYYHTCLFCRNIREKALGK